MSQLLTIEIEALAERSQWLFRTNVLTAYDHHLTKMNFRWVLSDNANNKWLAVLTELIHHMRCREELYVLISSNDGKHQQVARTLKRRFFEC